jgi:hypothetical protein
LQHPCDGKFAFRNGSSLETHSNRHFQLLAAGEISHVCLLLRHMLLYLQAFLDAA